MSQEGQSKCLDPPNFYRQFLVGAGNPVLRKAAWSHLSSSFFVFPRNPYNKLGMVVCPCAVLGKQRQEGLNSYPAQPVWCAPGSSSAWLVCPRIMRDPASKGWQGLRDGTQGQLCLHIWIWTYTECTYTQRREKEQEVCVCVGGRIGREKRKKEGPRISRISCVFSTIPGNDHE